jgi:hypothetical protein
MQTGGQDRLSALVRGLQMQREIAAPAVALPEEPDGDLSWSAPDGTLHRLRIYIQTAGQIGHVVQQRATHTDAPWEEPWRVTLAGGRWRLPRI